MAYFSNTHLHSDFCQVCLSAIYFDFLIEKFEKGIFNYPLKFPQAYPFIDGFTFDEI